MLYFFLIFSTILIVISANSVSNDWEDANDSNPNVNVAEDSIDSGFSPTANSIVAIDPNSSLVAGCSSNASPNDPVGDDIQKRSEYCPAGDDPIYHNPNQPAKGSSAGEPEQDTTNSENPCLKKQQRIYVSCGGLEVERDAQTPVGLLKAVLGCVDGKFFFFFSQLHKKTNNYHSGGHNDTGTSTFSPHRYNC